MALQIVIIQEMLRLPKYTKAKDSLRLKFLLISTHSNPASGYKSIYMKKLIIVLLFVAFNANAQESFFRGNNNYVGPVAPLTLNTQGLILHVDAGNTASYVGSGTTWNDLSVSNHGILTNGPVYTTENGGSIVFDGIDDVISFGNILNMGLSSWTISCWVKFDGGAGLMGIIGKTSYRSYEGRYSIYIDNNNLVAFFQPSISIPRITGRIFGIKI